MSKDKPKSGIVAGAVYSQASTIRRIIGRLSNDELNSIEAAQNDRDVRSYLEIHVSKDEGATNADT